MPLPTVDLVKVNLVGHLPGSEVFNWGFWLAPSVDPTQSQLNTMATDIAALITSTTFSYAKSMIDSSSGYDKVRLYSYPSGFQTAQKVAGGHHLGHGDGHLLSPAPGRPGRHHTDRYAWRTQPGTLLPPGQRGLARERPPDRLGHAPERHAGAADLPERRQPGDQRAERLCGVPGRHRLQPLHHADSRGLAARCPEAPCEQGDGDRQVG